MNNNAKFSTLSITENDILNPDLLDDNIQELMENLMNAEMSIIPYEKKFPSYKKNN